MTPYQLKKLPHTPDNLLDRNYQLARQLFQLTFAQLLGVNSDAALQPAKVQTAWKRMDVLI